MNMLMHCLYFLNLQWIKLKEMRWVGGGVGEINWWERYIIYSNLENRILVLERRKEEKVVLLPIRGKRF